MEDSPIDEMDLERQVIKLLSSCFSVGRRTIDIESRLVEDLYVDSVGMVETVMALNETFGIELPEEGVEMWKTVGDICDLIKLTKLRTC